MKARISFVMIQISLMGAICSVAGCQTELYKIQHDEQLPPADSAAAFERAMTTKGADNHGPYPLTTPVNPFNGSSVVQFETGQSIARHSKAGWGLNITTGTSKADDYAIMISYIWAI